MLNRGMNADTFKETITRGVSKKAAVFQPYVRVHGNPKAPSFYSVMSEVDGLPHFITWTSYTNITKTRPLSTQAVMDSLSSYMANMTDEELKLFKPLLIQLLGMHDIFGVSCYPGVVEIHTEICGEPATMCVTVFNMHDLSDFEVYQHHYARNSLN